VIIIQTMSMKVVQTRKKYVVRKMHLNQPEFPFSSVIQKRLNN